MDPIVFDVLSSLEGALSSLADGSVPVSDAVPDPVLVPGLAQAQLASVEGWARNLLDAASGPWQYALVFALAATPLLEILVVIPLGVALDLDPVGVAIVAFAGNVLPIYGIVLAADRVMAWLEGRRSSEPSKRRKRAVRIWNRYGLPGLALLSPVTTGVHLAAVLALSLGARGRDTLAWMTASIALWTVLITIASVVGRSAIEGAF
ncbi:small multi-drug export protein [Natronosalvus halobius]|uniref:small multi-drug export protein n=1 Tax=Natronosalvus halobius TaxID=2953746 RepID=UPI0020A157DF|nr:small multi-drug export protein [Natronosalvus halobius]USZ71646.1 small multi-drug export protein [Natronosalvus halobius]